MKIKNWLVVACIFCIFLSGCSIETQTPAEIKEIPFSFIDSNGRQPISWNEEIKLELPENLPSNTLQSSAILHILVYNLSNDRIRFPLGFNLKIYDYTNGIKEITNLMHYSGIDRVLEPGSQKIGSYSPIGFTPDIYGGPDRKIRVFVIGELINDDPQKNELVGAYIDMVVHP